jgi:putative nucleotide binding protein
MIEALKQKLTDEADKLRFELNVTLPNEIRKAVELGDLRENSEYKAALERQQFVQARLTPRIHALELIPGIGKTYMMALIKGRESKRFESFQEIQDRIGLKDPAKLIAKRIVEEITGEARMNLFVRR